MVSRLNNFIFKFLFPKQFEFHFRSIVFLLYLFSNRALVTKIAYRRIFVNLFRNPGMCICVMSYQKFRLMLENVTGISEMTWNFASELIFFLIYYFFLVLVFLTQFCILFWNCAWGHLTSCTRYSINLLYWHPSFFYLK